MSLLPINSIRKPRKVTDGAGVNINRVFGQGDTNLTDPFLMLDHFEMGADSLGFPWHPHRGIETITYIIGGGVEHEDSLGNKGRLSSGDVQWMTAGSGIIHQEMPFDDGALEKHGFQLWANLPSSQKMTDPRYQDIPSREIPEVTEDDGTSARIITGQFWGKTGPVEGIATDPRLLDITVPAGVTRTIKVSLEHNAFAYVFQGNGKFYGASHAQPAPTEYVTGQGVSPVIPAREIDPRTLILFDRGDELKVTAGEEGLRFLLVSGRPLQEPVAWYGPIVMNTEEELITAFREYEEGSFLKHK